MNLSQIISVVVVALLPVAFVIASNISRRQERRHLLLAQFIPMSVMQVEQQNAALSGPAKKALAKAFVAKAFKASHLAPFPDEIVDAAIEAAVFSLPKR